jgi:hypothetical protein
MLGEVHITYSEVLMQQVAMVKEEGNGIGSILLKSEIPIKWDENTCSIGGLDFPGEIFAPVAGRELAFRKGWQIDTALRTVEDQKELHYRISFKASQEDVGFFIPSAWITKFVYA